MKKFRNKRINSIKNISNNISYSTVPKFRFKKLKRSIRRNYRIMDWRYSNYPILRDIGYSIGTVSTIPELIEYSDPKCTLYQEADEPIKLRNYSRSMISISFYRFRRGII